MVYRVVVVGAGIIGLSTAVNIQESLPRADVVIVADRFATDTTSDGAAGVLFPMNRAKTIPPQLYKQWVQDSFIHFSSLARSNDAVEYGVGLICGYYLFNQDSPEPFAKDFFVDFHRITDEERKKIGQENKFGYVVTTFIASPRTYMPWLTKRFTDNGGRFENRKILSFEEFVGSCDVVVNCTGLESRWLVNDPELYPIRGQTIRVEAPWIKEFQFHKPHSYIIPTVDGVVLSIARQRHDYDTSVRAEESTDIMDVCCKILPSLKDSKVIREWVGLRPHRDEPRVETDTLKYPSGSVRVVHNYGHGGDGICLSWGTGKYAAHLVKQQARGTEVASKL